LTLGKDRYAAASAAPAAKSPVGPSSAGFHLAFGSALRQAHAYLQRPGIVPLLIILLWACAVLPNLTVRSFIYEEGTNAEIARDVLAHGHFLNPFVYGVRWHEKPSLLGWLIAGVALIVGGVNEWSARLPAMLSVLATALLVHRVTRHYASPAASLFAALSFLFCPLLLQKLTIAEPDTIVTVLSFAALVVWWDGAASGRVTLWRWGACGLLLAALSMAKGPQPAGFFALGVAAYLLIERRWRDLPGFLLCMMIPLAATIAWGAAIYQPGDEGTWLSYARLQYHPAFGDYAWRIMYNIGSLFLELLPASVLLPFIPWPWRHQKGDVPAVIAPMVLYSSVCTVILFLWPGVNTRYAMPIAPSVAVLAGIAWDRLEKSRYSAVRRFATTALSLFIIYQVVLVVVIMPLFADRFGETRIAGEAIGRAVRATPAPAYCLHLDTNMLFYAKIPVQCLDMQGLAALTPPAWLLIPAPYLAELARLRLDVKLNVAVGPLTEAQLTATHLEQK
jgi:4-amino-4-deoxy-L-arabinose transferase-like glycosyltransferase